MPPAHLEGLDFSFLGKRELFAGYLTIGTGAMGSVAPAFASRDPFLGTV